MGPLGEALAYVRLRVNPSQVEADTARGIEQGVAGSKVTAASARAGSKAGKGFAGSFSSSLSRGLPSVAREGEKAGASWGSRFGAGLGSTVAKTAKFGGLALVAAGAASIKLSVDFQTAMKRVQTQAGASSRDVQVLSKGILGMRDVQQGPIQLADAMFHLKSVGLDNVKALQALHAASQLAAVGGADLEETTNAIAGAWRSGIRGAQSFGQAAATVNAIIGAGNMRMGDFISAIGTGFLPSARSFGLSLKNVGAALALMTDEGIPATVAATRLRMSFSLLGAPSDVANKQLKTIGLSGLQLAEAMRGPQGLIGAIGLLKSHLDSSGLSAAKQSILLSHAFGGGRSSSAILTLLNNYDVLVRKQDQINHSLGKFGPAVAAQAKTAGAQLHLLGADFENIGVRLGTTVLPVVTRFLGFLARQRVLIPVLTGVVVGLTAALVAMAIAWLATPFGQVAAGIALITAGVILMRGHWQQVWDWFKGHQWVALLMPGVGVLLLFAAHWKLVANVALTAAILLVKAARAIVAQFLGMVGKIVHGAAVAFGWIPGIGGKLKAADKAFQGFSRGVLGGFDTAISKLNDWQSALNRSGRAAQHHSDVVSRAVGGITSRFDAQDKAAGAARNALNRYTTSLINNGTGAKQTEQARRGLMADLTRAGVRAGQARADMNRYTTALTTNGNNSDQVRGARRRLVQDILAAQTNAALGRREVSAYTRAVNANGANSDAARGARRRLISDLVAAGVDAGTARRLVAGLNTAIRNVPGGRTVHFFGRGAGKVSFRVGTTGEIGRAAGGLLTGGQPGRDSIPFLGMPGEVVVPTAMVKAGAVDHLRGLLPGFQRGGLISESAVIGGSYNGTPPGMGAFMNRKQGDIAAVAAKQIGDVTVRLAREMAAAAAAGSGAVGGDAAKNKALARRMFPWGPGEWPSYVALEMREAGFNRFARNPASGAYGIPQALPPTKMPLAAQAAGGSHAGPQLSWQFGYIRGRYGTPSAAEAHEQRFGWYAGGTAGALPGWAVVGERGRELVRFGGGETVLPHAATEAVLRGYATGTSDALSVTRSIMLARTSGTIWADIHRLIKEINAHFTGSHERWRDRQIMAQGKDMAAAAKHLSAIKATAAAARSYQSSVKSGLSGYAALSTTTLGGGGIMSGGQLVQQGGAAFLNTQLKGKLGSLRKFSRALRKLTGLGASPGLLRQVVSLGPDDGTAYANELISAGAKAVKAVSGTLRAIGAEETAISRGAASAVYGGSYRTGTQWARGVAAQEARLQALMRRLGRTLGTEGAKWLGVRNPVTGKQPRKHKAMAGGGFITEPVYGIGESGTTYSFGEGGEAEEVVPGGRRTRHGPLIGTAVIRTEADAVLVADRLGFHLLHQGGGG
jgi:TP901 family phage tail tape measure protein